MQPLAIDKGTSSKSMQLLPGHWYGSLPTLSLKGRCPLWLSHASKTVPNEFLLTCSSSGKPGGSNPFPDTFSFLVSTKTLGSDTKTLILVPPLYLHKQGMGRADQQQSFPRALK